MNVDILSQFASPPVPNLPALAIAMAPGMPQHQQPMMAPPPVSMAMPTPPPQVMGMTSAAPAQALPNPGFLASFPPVQVTHQSITIATATPISPLAPHWSVC